eukprot:TRINITY_DN32562_c0_g1_i1.p2 TRINITY_DN32562_c0_g1~~TRINITY_DN32562_c0_g1_i1.p2  ORF type:complete len:281 (+),score=102.87 TRINITY_DN32562_c0_g1_i1:88-930(+)
MDATTAFVEDLKSKKKDYYALLGVAKDANETEINKAYKKLALRLHPDKCKHKDAQGVFSAVCDAKNVLLDPNKRQVYDQGGADGLENEGPDFDFSLGLRILLDHMFRLTAYKKYRRPFMPEPDVAFNERGERIDVVDKVTPLPTVAYFFPLLLTILGYWAATAWTDAPVEYSLRHPSDDLGLTERLDAVLASAGAALPDTAALGAIAFYVSPATAALLAGDADRRAQVDAAVLGQAAADAAAACKDARHVATQLRHRGHAEQAKEHVKQFCRVGSGKGVQ